MYLHRLLSHCVPGTDEFKRIRQRLLQLEKLMKGSAQVQTQPKSPSNQNMLQIVTERSENNIFTKTNIALKLQNLLKEAFACAYFLMEIIVLILSIVLSRTSSPKIVASSYKPFSSLRTENNNDFPRTRYNQVFTRKSPFCHDLIATSQASIDIGFNYLEKELRRRDIGCLKFRNTVSSSRISQLTTEEWNNTVSFAPSPHKFRPEYSKSAKQFQEESIENEGNLVEKRSIQAEMKQK